MANKKKQLIKGLVFILSVIFADEEQLNNIKSESNFNKVGLNLFV